LAALSGVALGQHPLVSRVMRGIDRQAL
jgi:hypothetical protein